MSNKREEYLSQIESCIKKWKDNEKDESQTLDDIYDVMSDFHKWEDEEFRKRRKEEWAKNAVTIKGNITYGGKLPISKIERD